MTSTVTPFDRLKTALAERERDVMHIEGFRKAAVLVPILQKEDGFELLFTVRSADLSSHAGQISFPGGRCDPGETITEAARRETLEEVGLTVAESDLLGFLDDHPSPARYIVTPVVALLPYPEQLKLNPAEVDAVFTAPLRDLFALTPYTEERQLMQYRRTLHFYPYGKQLIWGLTGNVLKNLLELLAETGS